MSKKKKETRGRKKEIKEPVTKSFIMEKKKLRKLEKAIKNKMSFSKSINVAIDLFLEKYEGE